MFNEILYKTDQITHEILKQCDGMEVSFVLDDQTIDKETNCNGNGILFYDTHLPQECIYILNDSAKGSDCGENKQGFKYSWCISFIKNEFEKAGNRKFSHIKSLTIYKNKAKELCDYTKIRNYLEGILK